MSMRGDEHESDETKRDLPQADIETNTDASGELDRLRRVLSSVSDGLMVIGNRGCIEYINPALSQILALPEGAASDLIGKGYLKAMAGLPGCLTKSLYRQVMEDRQPVELDFFHHDWNFWFTVRAYPVRDGGASVLYHDTTAQKTAEKTLRESETVLRRTLESISDGFLTIDTDWRLVTLNAASLTLLNACGLDIEQMVGALLIEAFPELAGSEMEKQIRKSLVLRLPTRFEYFHVTCRRWFSCQCYPIVGNGVSLYFSDITSRKEAEARQRENERYLQRLVESVADTFQIVGRDWSCQYANESARVLTMLEGREIVIDGRRTLWEIYPEMKGTPVENALCRTMYERVPTQFEHMHQARCFLTRAAPIEGGGLSLSTQDITERKVLEDALRHREMRWRTLTDAMPQIVWIGQAETGQCTYVNDQCVQYTGAPAEAFLDFGWSHFIHPDDRETAMQEWRRAIGRTDVFDIDFRMRRYDGVFRWFKVRGIPLTDPDGRVKEWYGTCTDIQDTVEARLQAESANRAKSEFLAHMSHEIRTPLNAIVGLTSIMMRFDDEAAIKRKFLTTLQDSAGALTELISDVLEYAKIDANMVELEESDFCLGSLLDQAVRMSSIKAQQKGLTLELQSDIDGEAYYAGDCNRIRQILLNLLANAVKFTETGRVDLIARCQPDGVGSQLTVTVKDTGIGIAPDKLGHIFEKFTQADSSITRRFGGTGLGLAISRRLAEAMNGSLSVESKPGVGSSFTLTVPLRPTKPLAKTTEHDMLDTSEKASHILLVEDSPTNSLVTETMLTRLGYHFTSVSDGREAIEAWRDGKFDTILMDLQMPNMDGVHAARLIRNLERSTGARPVHIVAMTAYAMSEDRERCLAAGMDDYMTKPFQIKELMEKLAVADA